jgi:hypothetical protein
MLFFLSWRQDHVGESEYDDREKLVDESRPWVPRSRGEGASSWWTSLVYDARKPWPLCPLNRLAAGLHLLQALVVLIMIFVHFDKVEKDVPYLSNSLELHDTNYVFVVRKPGTNESRDGLRRGMEANECEDVRSSASRLVWYRDMPDIVPHSFYNFEDVSVVRYNKGGLRLSPAWMMFAFFVLSFGFQGLNGWLLREDPDRPRVWSYVEYAFSSSLMIVVMGLNTGLYEVYTLTSLFGLFFGMNFFGVCAELLCCSAEALAGRPSGTSDYIGPYTWVWAHLAGWVLFLFAWIPCLVSFSSVHTCSDRNAPWFIVGVTVMESLCFWAFGLVQVWCLWMRSQCMLVDGGGGGGAWGSLEGPVRSRVLFVYDAWTIGLSLVAKTFLAWMLLAPRLAVSV